MPHALLFPLRLIRAMNRRALIGGSGLALLLIGQGVLAALGPFA